MALTTSILGAIQPSAEAESGNGVLREVNMDTFLKLLIAELQNQDPMEPMDNVEILQQVSQIREVESNTQLTKTLEAVLLGQNMTTAAGMIGRWVEAINSTGQRIAGRVDRVSVVDGQPKLIVDNQEIDLKNVAAILTGPVAG